MCLTIKQTCTECGKEFYVGGWPRNGSGVETDPVALGERLVKLATQAAPKYYFMCVDCILDEGCIYRWETDGGK
jgi:hypothetical protein